MRFDVKLGVVRVFALRSEMNKLYNVVVSEINTHSRNEPARVT